MPAPGAVDTSVRIPAAVKAASAQADEAYKAVYQPAAPEPEQPAADVAAQPAEDVTQKVTPETPPTEPAAADTSWERRFKSMKGRYDKDVRVMSEQITTLQRALSAAEARGADPAPTAPARERLITPEEEETYGSDFLGVVAKKAREELAPLLAEKDHKIAELERRLEGVGGYVQQVTREQLFTGLDAQVPEWRDLNDDPAFIQWLQLPDAYSGAIRQSLLDRALERNDFPRVIAFFKGFLSEEAAVAPRKSEAVSSHQVADKVPLETFAAPGRARSAAANTAPAEKPTFTGAQIDTFYADVRAGRFRGREADKDKLEREIFAAIQDGRIR